ncbi:MAG: DUF2318 domain-containing protein [Thermoplasmata archaeon]|nr:DUF2318 domain-containing protein [Thermoplasmata archaeon]
MACGNCGKSYSINQIGTSNQGGGCWPGYLEHSIEGSIMIIQEGNLETGRKYFE